MRTLSASELGNFLYCQRAWWYKRKGEASQNVSELAGGTQLHQAHGRKVFISGILKLFGWCLLFCGLVFLIYSLVSQFL